MNHFIRTALSTPARREDAALAAVVVMTICLVIADFGGLLGSVAS